jgi:hypothetical protein
LPVKTSSGQKKRIKISIDMDVVSGIPSPPAGGGEKELLTRPLRLKSDIFAGGSNLWITGNTRLHR